MNQSGSIGSLPEAGRGASFSTRVLARNPIGVYAGTIVAQGAILALGIGSGILSGRLLGPDGRGSLAAITLWPSALAVLASFGINQGLVYQAGKARCSVSETCSAAFTIGAAQSALVAAAGLLLLPLVLHSYPPGVLRLALYMLAATPALILGGYPGNVLQGVGSLGAFNALRMAAPGVYTAGLVVLWLTHTASLQNVVAVQITGYVLTLGAGCFLLRSRLHPNLIACGDAARDLLHYGSRAQVTNLTTYLNQRCDQLVLSLLVAPGALGLYAVGVTLAGAVGFLPQAAGLVTFSHAAREVEGARATIARSFRISLLWLLLASSILFVLAPVLVNSVFGSAFGGASIVCRILLPGMIAVGLNNVLYGAANAMGRPALPSVAELTGLVVTAVGLVAFVPKYGYLAAAVVSTLAYLTSLLVMLCLSARVLHLELKNLLLAQPQSISMTVEPVA